jgi:hypothetical protein
MGDVAVYPNPQGCGYGLWISADIADRAQSKYTRLPEDLLIP